MIEHEIEYKGKMYCYSYEDKYTGDSSDYSEDNYYADDTSIEVRMAIYDERNELIGEFDIEIDPEVGVEEEHVISILKKKIK